MSLNIKSPQFSSLSRSIMPKQWLTIFTKQVSWAGFELFAMILSRDSVSREVIMNSVWIFEEHLNLKISFGKTLAIEIALLMAEKS